MLRYKISMGVAAERADASVDAVAVSNKMDLQKQPISMTRFVKHEAIAN